MERARRLTHDAAEDLTGPLEPLLRKKLIGKSATMPSSLTTTTTPSWDGNRNRQRLDAPQQSVSQGQFIAGPVTVTPTPLIQRYDKLFKVILLGDPSVGKTNLTRRFCESGFDQSYAGTIGVDFKVRTVDIDGTKIKLQIWDTAGQERFLTITQVYYRGSHGALFVYDITDRQSFEHLRTWLQRFDDNAGVNSRRMIVGNKADKPEDRKVSFEEAETVAVTHHCRFLETSAKSGYNVENVFFTLAKDIKNHLESNPQEIRSVRTIRLTPLNADKTRRGKRKPSWYSKCTLL